jgi:hypothetical protein
MTKVLKADCSAGDAYAKKSIAFPDTGWYVQADIAVPSTTLAAIIAHVASGSRYTANPLYVVDAGSAVWVELGDAAGDTAGLTSPCSFFGANSSYVAAAFAADTWVTVVIHYDGTVAHYLVNGVEVASGTIDASSSTFLDAGGKFANHVAGEIYYVRDVKVGTTLGGVDLFSDDFSSGDLSSWTTFFGAATVVDEPTLTPPGPPVGRVLIAPDDGPLEPSPTWVRLDDVDNFVAAIDISRGRQTLTSHTDTGTATVLFNDTQGILDPNNVSSPYFGKITGKQIMLQVWNPVTAAWVPQFRGRIKRRGFDVNPATNPDGSLVVANIQMDCVDIFDYLGGYGLTPGLDGVTPPAGSEGTVWYAETAGTVDDRIIEVLTDVGIDSTMWVVFTGNIRAAEVNYDADEAAITVLRDACDAELPFIANCYVDKLGRFVFHGRESRFDPDTVAAGATPGAWNFTRWKAGDGAAILLDSDRAQIRVLTFNEDEDELINAAICYPKGIAETDIPGQVFADATSIAAHGKHAAPPISDLVIKAGVTTGNSGKVECQKYAELLVKNKKDPRVAIETLGLKAMHPSDARAAKTWALLTGSDISDSVNLKVGYPGGTGIGDPTGEDYYIEGVTMRIRPLVPEYDYVELELDVSPAEWSTDTHAVFA